MQIILCECGGRISSRLDLGRIKCLLEQGGDRVCLEGDICRAGFNGSLSGLDERSSLVVGACWGRFPEDECRNRMRKQGVDPFALAIVPLLGEGSDDRALSRIAAAIERLKLFEGSSEKNLRPRFGAAGGHMSRRQLLTMPRIRYDLIPSVEPSRCLSAVRQCRLCMRHCRSGAISLDEEGIALIEKEKCKGCGICTRECPAGAIRYPSCSPAEILKQVETLLQRRNGTACDPRAILFACRKSALLKQDFADAGGTFPEEVFPVDIPCLGMMDAFFFLSALALGATAIGLLPCSQEGCPGGGALARVRAEKELAEAIIGELGIRDERIRIIEHDSPDDLLHRIRSFGESLGGLAPVRPLIPVDMTRAFENHSLADFISRSDSGHFVLEGLAAIPTGMLRLAGDSSCTLCGVCAEYCPSGALRLEEEGSRELRFSYGTCVGCGECLRRCPEKTLRMRKVLDAERLREQRHAVLAQEALIRCPECGDPFLTASMFRRISQGLPDTTAAAVLRMCPDCRGRTAFTALW